MTFNYNYVSEIYRTPYANIDLTKCKIVNAKYIPAVIDTDRGNPYIESLPYPRDDEDVMNDYSKNLLIYDYETVKTLSKFEKLMQVSTLRQIRFPLSFHKNLEFAFYNALVTSYRSRNPLPTKLNNIEFMVNDQPDSTHCILCGDSGDSTNAGFSLIGYSGCGKSSAIHTLLSRYPQTVIHKIDDFKQCVQIVYLVVNCVPNSNFSALYEGIGDAIDKALGNTKPIYSKEISKVQNLGKKMEKVRELIERFAIGIIIFDEIQLINFDRAKESSFESLMTLANRTKVAMAVVGTEDARDKMFKELRTSRRIGTVINGNQYCDNKKFFSFLVKKLFQYQWFDEPVKPTDDLVDALYDVTKGIVDQLIGIYSWMHYDYLERKNKPVINASYVYEITQKYYPGIQNVLAELESVESARKLMEIRQEANVRVEALLDYAQQELAAETLVNGEEAYKTKITLLKNVIRNITAIYDDYTVSDIEATFNAIMKNNKNKTEKEISRLVIARLNSNQTQQKTNKKRQSIPNMNTSVMRDFINEHGGDE